MLHTAYLWSSAFTFLFLGVIWSRNSWLNAFLKFYLFVGAIAAFALLAGVR